MRAVRAIVALLALASADMASAVGDVETCFFTGELDACIGCGEVAAGERIRIRVEFVRGTPSAVDAPFVAADVVSIGVELPSGRTLQVAPVTRIRMSVAMPPRVPPIEVVPPAGETVRAASAAGADRSRAETPLYTEVVLSTGETVRIHEPLPAEPRVEVTTHVPPIAGVFGVDAVGGLDITPSAGAGTSIRVDGGGDFRIAGVTPRTPDGCAALPPPGFPYSGTSFCGFDVRGRVVAFDRMASPRERERR